MYVGCLENPSGGTFIYSGGQDAKRGVGMMLSKNMKSHIIGYWAVSDRVLLVRILEEPHLIYALYKYMLQHLIMNKKR